MAYDPKNANYRGNDLHEGAKHVGMKSVKPGDGGRPFGITHGDPQAKQHTPRAAKPSDDPGLDGLSRQKKLIKKEIAGVDAELKARKSGRDE